MSSISIHPRSHFFDPHVATRFGMGFLVSCFLTIAIISAIDIWFAVANTAILRVEKNPICMALIELEPQGFTFFIIGKAAGTLMVLLTLSLLYRVRYRHANMVTFAIALFQIGLLMYLTLSDPLTHDLPNFGLLFGESNESVWFITDHH